MNWQIENQTEHNLELSKSYQSGFYITLLFDIHELSKWLGVENLNPQDSKLYFDSNYGG